MKIFPFTKVKGISFVRLSLYKNYIMKKPQEEDILLRFFHNNVFVLCFKVKFPTKFLNLSLFLLSRGLL